MSPDPQLIISFAVQEMTGSWCPVNGRLSKSNLINKEV